MDLSSPYRRGALTEEDLARFFVDHGFGADGLALLVGTHHRRPRANRLEPALQVRGEVSARCQSEVSERGVKSEVSGLAI